MDSIIIPLKQIAFKDIILILLGGLMGYFVNLLFYYKSKNSSTEKNLDRIFDLYHKITQSSTNQQTIQDIKDEIMKKNKLDDIHNELVTIRSQLSSTSTPNDNDIIRYKLLGDKWSTEYLKTINPKILTTKGFLYFKNIQEFHKSIFPNGFPWAGKFRQDEVVITNTFGTAFPRNTQGIVDYSINPNAPKDIFKRMEEYCDNWNSKFNDYLHAEYIDKVQKVVQFHHEFQIIHPFFDGNGRIGRILLNDMLEFLLNKKITLKNKRDKYYTALRFADMGDLDKLTSLILQQLEK